MRLHGRRSQALFLAALMLPLAYCATIGQERVLYTGQPDAVLVCPRTVPAPPADRFRIGPIGGHLRVGENELRIPPHALSRDVIVTFGENPSDTVGVTLDTEGAEFAHEVELVISMERCGSVGSNWAIWRITPEAPPQMLDTRITGNRALTYFRSHSGFIIAGRTGD
jgi:hypothetical protein